MFDSVNLCDLGHLVQHFVVDISDFFFYKITQFENHNLPDALFRPIRQLCFAVINELVVNVKI